MGDALNPKFVGATFGIIAFLVLVMGVALVAQVLSAVQDTQTSTVTNQRINESLSGNTTLARAGTVGDPTNIENDTVRMLNRTSTATVVLTVQTHYNVSPAGDVNFTPAFIASVDSADYFVNATYNYTVFVEQAHYNISGSGVVAVASNVSDLIPTMALIFGIIVILGLLATIVFMFANRSG